MKALVTGIEGFVGPYLAKILMQEGIEVFGTFLNDISQPIKNVKNIHLDITDAEETNSVISETRPDMIFHLAGFSSVHQSWKNPKLCSKVNVDGTRNLLDAVCSAGIHPKILVVSSAEVYGKPESVPITESHSLNPENPYAKSRKQQEEVVLEYVKNKGIHAIISRSFNHTGPGQSPIFVCSDFAQQIVKIEKGESEAIIKTGDLTVKRDFTDVRDVVRAYILALKKGKSGEIYNICSGKAYSIQEILKTLTELSEKKDEIQIVQDSERIRPSETSILVGDNSKLIKDIGWSPEISFKQTLADILDWWRKNN